MTGAEALFIDTNILIYANVVTAPLHEQALNAIKRAHQTGRPLWISRQVLREFIATRTRPQTFAQPSAPQVVIERVRYLEERFQVADDTNIVATMLAHDIPCLLTHNVKDFERFKEVIRIEEIDSD